MTVTLTREEAQQVLNALESVYGKGKKCDAAIETLRARLSAPEPEQTRSEKMREAGITRRPKGWSKEDEPEPVAGYRWEEGRTPPSVTFAAPPQREWQSLTDEEIRNEAKNHVFDESFFSGAIWARGQIMRKNNG